MNNSRILEQIKQMVIGQMWLVDSLLEIYDYCADSKYKEFEYIDDLPLYEYISNSFGHYNQKLRKQNKNFLKDFINNLTDILDSESLYDNGQIENFKQGVDGRLSNQRNYYLKLLRLVPNLDTESMENLSLVVDEFNKKFFGRKDLGESYREAFELKKKFEKMESTMVKFEKNCVKKFNKSLQTNLEFNHKNESKQKYKKLFLVKDGEIEEKKPNLEELVEKIKNSISLESKQFGFEKARGKKNKI